MKQFFVSASFDDSSLFQHIDAVSHPDGGKAMTDQDSSPIRGKLTEILKNRILGFGIQRTGRFVQNDDLRVAQKYPGQRNLLPLADAEFLTILKQFAEDCFVAFGQPADNVIRSRVSRRGYDPLVVGRKIGIPQPDILASCQVVL